MILPQKILEMIRLQRILESFSRVEVYQLEVNKELDLGQQKVPIN